jgi:hypothetical protein
VPSEHTLVIIRDISVNHDKVQHFLPSRLLLGAMPSALLEMYNFWQNEDDSLTGYMPLLKNFAYARSILNVNKKTAAHKGLPTIWTVSRSFLSEDPGKDPVVEAFSTNVDKSKPALYLVNLLSVLGAYSKYLLKGDVAKLEAGVGGDFGDFTGEQRSLHALVRMLLRLDSLSSVIAWSVSPPEDGPTTIDLVELPRLHLTFEKRLGSAGNVRYFCVEQSGLFLSGYRESLGFSRLLHDLPHAVLLSNNDAEYFILLSCTSKPLMHRTVTDPPSTTLTVTKCDKIWNSKTSAESSYFLYPVHASGAFLSSCSVASSMYLLLFRMVMSNYKEAFKLIESCICDRVMSAQEQQIYTAICELKYDVHPDAHAFRLKLFFVTYGCISIMPYPYIVEDEIVAYISKFSSISACCRLSYEEEAFIMAQVPQSSPIRSIHFLNRESIIRNSFDIHFDTPVQKSPSRTFSPQYPTLLVYHHFF